MQTCTIIAAVALTSIINVSAATADGVSFPFKMSRCPTPLTVSAPAIFMNGKPDQKLLDEISAFPHGEGEYVLAITTPSEPSLILMILEPNGIDQIQGKITQDQFDKVKTEFLAKDPLGVRQEANQHLKQEGVAFNDVGAFTSSSDATSATMTTALKGSAPGADFESITSYKIGYVRQCIAGAILIAPVSSMPRNRLEELARSLSFQ